ncbi:thioredoxin domain-containing protein [Sulfolobales archaeon HS-7]|nr:thioredoxin domain-containing protein [Sulfolobales archaeon HS-7]
MNQKLAKSSSSYLREAISQPVEWRIWNDEAFAEAKNLNRPILVDVGASWCHWCHVMDRETYDNEDIARIINENFIPIKVDRDEMPDIDRKLQKAVYEITGQSGWPLTVFMTPEGLVFFGGTYFPPEDKLGIPGMKRVLTSVISYWKDTKGNVEGVKFNQLKNTEGTEIDPQLTTESILTYFDWDFGGIEGGMKFPHPPVDSLLLAEAYWNNDDLAKKAVYLTLKNMYMGGLMDQVGGGFHRYTVDREWWVPHFEKLLIDNAEILITYVNAYTYFRDEQFLDAINMSISFLDSIRDDDGLASSVDADSEGVEGKYYTWTVNEVKEIFPENPERVIRLFSMDIPGGEVEGRKVLKRKYDNEEISKRFGVNPTVFLTETRRRMLAERMKRIPPMIDKNKYSYPNFRAVEAYLWAGELLDVNTTWAQQLLKRVNKITRRINSGGEPLFEDFAAAASCMIKAYEITSDEGLLDKAISYVDEIKEVEFPPIEEQPSFSPTVLLGMIILKINSIRPGTFSESLLNRITGMKAGDPLFSSGLALLRELKRRGVAHIVITGDDENSRKLLRRAVSLYYPLKVVERVKGEKHDNPVINSMLTKTKGNGTAFVCVGHKCSPPVSDPTLLIVRPES